MSFLKATVTNIDTPYDFQPPFDIGLPEFFRRVSKDEAARHPRPHRLAVVGGPHDGYEEFWVADSPCGCEHHS